MTRRLRIGVTQWHATIDVARNLDVACALISDAGLDGADVVALPENGLCLGTNAEMRDRAMRLEGSELATLADAATAAGTVVILGGFKRRIDEATIRNTAAVFAPGHGVVGIYDKVHLFDARVGGVSFEASNVEQAGDHPVLVDIGGVSLGLMICYDVRFPELARRLTAGGAEVLLYPSAFTRITGAAHWDVLLRARAIENLAFVVAPATMHGDGDAFATYGHAYAVSPWGEVLCDLGDAERASAVVELDLESVAEARAAMPALNGVRPDAYLARVEHVIVPT